MSPDEIRRSWDDDDTPRSAFPEPLAERLTRENKELRAEVERLGAALRFELDDICLNGEGAFEAHDRRDRLRAVLDKHAGEQP
jgi:hypothetical protein